MRPEDPHPLAIGEWRRAGEALVRDARERVHVGLRRHLRAMDLLGRHVVERADGLPRSRQQAALAVLGEAEVRQVGVALGVDQDVGGLDVAVEEALGVEASSAPATCSSTPSATGGASQPSRSRSSASEPPSMKRCVR